MPDAPSAHLVREWLEGAGFVLQAPLSLACTLATALILDPASARTTAVRILVFACIAGGSGWFPLPGAAFLPPLALITLGIAVAGGAQLRGSAAALALSLGALSAGIAGGMQTATIAEAAAGSLGLCGLLALLGWLSARARELPASLARAFALARRMAGAWIGAVGSLVLALMIRTGQG